MDMQAFKLRYDVYCLERNYLPAENYPDGIERDEFDAKSAHFSEFDEAGNIVGYVRLVRAAELSGFPFVRHTGAMFAQAIIPEASESAEISRLIVHPELRRRRKEAEFEGEILVQDAGIERARGTESHDILSRMYRQMYVYSLQTGIRYWYAAMELVLARSLRQMCFPFRQVGEKIDYYGPVAPYLLDLRELEVRLGERRPAFLAWIQEGLLPGWTENFDDMPQMVCTSTPTSRKSFMPSMPAGALHRAGVPAT